MQKITCFFNMQKAIKNGNLDKVKLFLNNGEHKDEIIKAFVDASTYGHMDIVKFFLTEGFTKVDSIHWDDSHPLNALDQALKNEHNEIVKYLISNGAYSDEILGDSEHYVFNTIDELIEKSIMKGSLMELKNILSTSTSIKDLIVASANTDKDTDMLKFFMSMGFDINFDYYRDLYPQKAIFSAIRYDNIEILSYLMSRYNDQPPYVMNDSLEVAIDCHNIVMLKYLISHGYTYSDNILNYAAEVGCVESAKYLVSSGYLITQCAFNESVLRNNREMIKYLLTSSNNINIFTRYNGVLNLATTLGYSDVLNCLVSRFTDKTHHKYFIYAAIINGNIDKLKQIESQSVNIYKCSNGISDRCSISLASEKGKIEIVKYLVSRCVHTINYHKLITETSHFEVVKYLVEKSDNIWFHELLLIDRLYYGSDNKNIVQYIFAQYIFKQYTNNKGLILLSHSEKIMKKCIDYAIKHKDLQFIKTIFGCRYDNDILYYALSNAIDKNYLELLKYLIDIGILLPNLDDAIKNMLNYSHNEFSPQSTMLKYVISISDMTYLNKILKWAMKTGAYEIIEYLVLKGADIHVDNDYCIRHAKFLDVVEYLVSEGADIHANNDEALRISSKNNNYRVVRYLLFHGANVNANNDEALRNACMSPYYYVTEHIYEYEYELSRYYNHEKTIKYLLLNGANIDSIDPLSNHSEYVCDLIEIFLKARRKIKLIRNICLLQRFVSNYNVAKYIKYIPGIGINYIDALNHFEE